MSLGGAGDLGGAFIERGLKAGGRHRERGLTAGALEGSKGSSIEV